jgi:hypothetical protein
MPSRRALLGLGAVFLAGRQSPAGAQRGARTPPSLLRHHPGDLYFTNAEGRQVYLAGIHTWPASQDRGPAFDWPGFLALQERIGGNLIRMWGIDGADDHSVRGPTYPLPYARTADGRFDLTRFDRAFFDRVRERAIEAGERGMYVIQMLFNGWGLQFGEPRNPFDASPWKAGNNVNGVDGDPRGTGKGTDVQTLKDPAITALQEAYVRRVVDALDDLPNVLFEVSNETANTDEAWAWQNHMLGVVKRHDASRGLVHPAGLTSSAWGDDRAGIDARLARSDADWTSPGGQNHEDDPPAATGAKVSVLDTDHIWGIGGQSVDWVWKAFTRGHNLLSMDSLRTPDLAGRSVRYDADTTPEQIAAEDAAREGIRQTRMAAEMLDLRGVRSRGDLCSTGYALADPADGDFVAYAPEGGGFALDLSGAAGKRLAVRWVDVGAGTVAEGGAVEGGNAAQRFAAPAGKGAALVLRPAERATPDRRPPG